MQTLVFTWMVAFFVLVAHLFTLRSLARALLTLGVLTATLCANETSKMVCLTSQSYRSPDPALVSAPSRYGVVTPYMLDFTAFTTSEKQFLLFTYIAAYEIVKH